MPRSTRPAPSLVALLAALVAAAWPSLASAADPPKVPKGTAAAVAPATKGATDVAAADTFAAATKAEEKKAKDATEASISAGGLFTSGNARTIALTAGGKLRLRRQEHQLGASFFGNYARAGKKGETVTDTVANLQGLLRYDYFFADRFAAFLQSTGRHDKFQGLDFRLTVDPGVAAYLLDTKKQRAWLEGGLQIQLDLRSPEAVATAGGALNQQQAFFNARFYAGYENQLYEGVSFVSGVEYIQNLHDTVSRYRLNLDMGLKAKVSDKLAVATAYSMRYENQPLPTVEKADSIASVNLVYNLF